MKSVCFLVFLFVFVNSSYVLEITNAGGEVPNPTARFYTYTEFHDNLPPSYNDTISGMKDKLNKVPLGDNYTFMDIVYSDGTTTHIDAIVNGCMEYVYPEEPFGCQ